MKKKPTRQSNSESSDKPIREIEREIKEPNPLIDSMVDHGQPLFRSPNLEETYKPETWAYECQQRVKRHKEELKKGSKVNSSIDFINSKARKRFVSLFEPLDDDYAKLAKSFDKEIETLALPFPFWEIAHLAMREYLVVEEQTNRQREATKKYRYLKYRSRRLQRLAKNVKDDIDSGLIEDVAIKAKPFIDIFDDPKEHTYLGEPINAFAKTMAQMLIYCGLSQKKASELTHKFIQAYFPKVSLDSENIRRNLQR